MAISPASSQYYSPDGLLTIHKTFCGYHFAHVHVDDQEISSPVQVSYHPWLFVGQSRHSASQSMQLA